MNKVLLKIRPDSVPDNSKVKRFIRLAILRLNLIKQYQKAE